MKDIKGRDIKEGDRIAFGKRNSRYPLRTGRVVSIRTGSLEVETYQPTTDLISERQAGTQVLVLPTGGGYVG